MGIISQRTEQLLLPLILRVHDGVHRIQSAFEAIAGVLRTTVQQTTCPDIQVLGGNPDPHASVKTASLQVNSDVRTLQRQITEVDSTHHEWLKYIQEAGCVAEKTKEANLYQGAVEEDNNFMDVLATAKALIDTLLTAQMTLSIQLGSPQAPASSPCGKVHVDTTRDNTLIRSQHSENSTTRIAMRVNPWDTVQLPKPQLQKFDSDRRRWPQFWATSKHMVDSQPLADIEKLAYLRNWLPEKLAYLLSYLDGKALEAVAGYNITPDNQAIVKETLQQRFGGTKVLRKALYVELQEPASPAKEFEEIVATLERIVQQLEQIGEDVKNAQTEL
ncbi:hypothetical protein AB6A40_002520 [Gnathostoma spinigerum]|uniref:Uncharacterized protein n=1 Tax=Gnathostoma spinigerum TaxID=75299 RepID=A0ABD6E9D5_9BILA